VSYRSIAGNLELFSGAYCIAFGTLASVYFTHMHRPHVAMAAGVAALAGILLVTRASRLLGWKRWLFWSVVLVITIVPIVWFVPPLLQRP
jgi:hypothetical protein